MRGRFLFGFVAGAALVTAAAPAAANVVSFAMNGIMVDGLDGEGLFGAKGGDLTGDLVRVVFTFDTSIGNRGPIPADPPTPAATDSVSGGSNVPGPTPGSTVPSPLVLATFTIKGVTVSVGGDVGAAAATSPGNFMEWEAVGQGSNFLAAFDETLDAPASLDTPFEPHGLIVGDFFVGDVDTTDNTSGDFLGVPEPATWASMLLGIGAIGAAMRFTRRWRVPTAA